MRNGNIVISDVPIPVLGEEGVLVRNMYSLISTGTERSSIDVAKANLPRKAAQRPDLVRQVIRNVKQEGIKATYEKVITKLDTRKALGYSCTGKVIESSCEEYKPGDLVACAGADYAVHAEYVFVPKNLCAKLPKGFRITDAAFTTVGAIALQGVRQAEVRLGESVAVIGLGLVGILTLKLLNAAGCRVIGADIDETKVSSSYLKEAPRICSIDELVSVCDEFTSGMGADAVIITAATKSNRPVNLGSEIVRQKGRIVIVGAVGMNIQRDPHFYKKELEISMSTSYGPGRYDRDYEERGIDYPYAYVRWSEQRNMEAFINLIADGHLDVSGLMSHTFPIEDALDAYKLLNGKENKSFTGILLSYSQTDETVPEKVFANRNVSKGKGDICVGFIGMGNYARAHLILHIKNHKNVRLKTVCTRDGAKANEAAKRYGFETFTTDAQEIFSDPEINVVFIATRHDSHAQYVLDTLSASKHLFVEKPLCLSFEDLSKIKESYESVLSNEKYSKSGNETPIQFMVGFNRRFSKHAIELKQFFKQTEKPYFINYRVNAPLPYPGHWSLEKEQGNRIVSEGCHFIDLTQFITGSDPRSLSAHYLMGNPPKSQTNRSVSVTVEYEDGSLGNLQYISNGNSRLPKERIEVYNDGKVAILQNFQYLEFYEGGKVKRRSIKTGKGQKEEINFFLSSIISGGQAMSFKDIFSTTLVTFKIEEALSKGTNVTIDKLE